MSRHRTGRGVSYVVSRISGGGGVDGADEPVEGRCRAFDIPKGQGCKETGERAAVIRISCLVSRISKGRGAGRRAGGCEGQTAGCWPETAGGRQWEERTQNQALKTQNSRGRRPRPPDHPTPPRPSVPSAARPSSSPERVHLTAFRSAKMSELPPRLPPKPPAIP